MHSNWDTVDLCVGEPMGELDGHALQRSEPAFRVLFLTPQDEAGWNGLSGRRLVNPTKLQRAHFSHQLLLKIIVCASLSKHLEV